MAPTHLLGIDIGTSGSSGAIVDGDLNVVATAEVTHETSFPRPGWAEHDADDVWWRDFKRLSRDLLKRVDIEPAEIAGIGVSALHTNMLPLDENGTPLRPAILYGVDTRTREEIEILNDRIGEDRIFEVCGNRLTFQSVGPKLLWYKRNEPENFQRTESVLDATGYVVYRLTDNETIDHANASFFHPLYDLSEREWNDEMFEAAKLSRDLLPEPQWASEVAGSVTAAAAEATGLDEGTPVVVGTGDSIASLVGVAAVEDRDAIFMYGTTGVIYTTLESDVRTPKLWSFPHCLEDKYVLGGGMATAGAIVRWFKNEFGYEERQRAAESGDDPYELLDQKAAQVPPGSEGLVMLPYFSGERTPMNDDAARGMFAGLTLSHTKAHLYRAVLEGVGYGFRHHLDAMAEAGVDLETVTAIGGGARSPLWRRIVSDITGVTQEYVTNPVGSPLGDAYLAGLGTGVFDDLDAIRQKTSVTDRTTPDAERTPTYDEYYSVYQDLYPETRQSIHTLSALVDD